LRGKYKSEKIEISGNIFGNNLKKMWKNPNFGKKKHNLWKNSNLGKTLICEKSKFR